MSPRTVYQQRHPHCLALKMRPLKVFFFALFPDFKKVRSPGRQVSAELGGECQLIHAERSSNGSCRSRRALELIQAGVSAAVPGGGGCLLTSSRTWSGTRVGGEGCQWDWTRQRYRWWLAAEDGSLAWQGHLATPVGDRSGVVSGGGGGGGRGREELATSSRSSPGTRFCSVFVEQVFGDFSGPDRVQQRASCSRATWHVWWCRFPT